MSTFDRPREAAGTSRGGQFAAFTQAEASGTLEPGTDEWYDADQETAVAAVFDRDFMDDMQSATEIAATEYPNHSSELLGMLYEKVHQRVASAHAERRPLNLSDTHRVHWLTKVAKAQAYFAKTGLESGPDIAGFRKFNDLRIEKETAMGRGLTSTERDSLAEEVRASFPPKRRPGPAYFHAIGEQTQVGMTGHYLNSTSSSGVHYRYSKELDQQTQESSLVAESGDGWSVGLGGNPVMDEMMRISKAGSEYKRGTAARMVYALAASKHDAPAPVEGSVTDRTARAHRATLNEAGGVEAAVRSYERGQCDAATEKALFAPVTPAGRELSRREKASVCRALTHFEGGAEKTYSALVNTVLQHEAEFQRSVLAGAR